MNCYCQRCDDCHHERARLRALLAAVLWDVGPRLPESLRRAIEAEGIEPQPREEADRG